MMQGMAKSNNPMSMISNIIGSGNPQQMAMNMLKQQNPQMFSQITQLMQSGANPQEVMNQMGISEQQINQIKQMIGNNAK